MTILTYQQVSGVPPAAGTTGYRNLPPLLYPGVVVPFQELFLHLAPDADTSQTILARLFARDMPVVHRTFHVAQFIAGLKLNSAALHLADPHQWLAARELIKISKTLLLPIHLDSSEMVAAWSSLDQTQALVSPGTSDSDWIRQDVKLRVELAAQHLLPK